MPVGGILTAGARSPPADGAGLVIADLQVVHADRAAVGEQHRSLEHVLELADVARPVVAHQHLQRFRVDAFDLLLQLAREPAHEELGQRRDVFLAVAQRRHVDRDDVEPVEEVFAEAALGHHLS